MPYRAFDQIEVRCPKLGGEVTFGYCRQVNDGLPCSRALVCFEWKFPVLEYFKRVLKEKTLERCFFGQVEGRMEMILRTVDEAKKRVEQSQD